jgi:hypothetical protein
MYFDLLAEMVRYIEKMYPENRFFTNEREKKFFLSEHQLRLYSAKLWACETLIELCLQNQANNPINVIEEFVELHEIMIGELGLDNTKREYFAAALSVAYDILGHLKKVSK